jgi:endonuclease VIII
MSEGPEVRRIADKLSSALVGQTIEKIIFRNAESQEIIQRLRGVNVEQVQTHGKNIVILFSNGIFLRNHMMMWGKWRIYDRKQYDEGRAKPPLRREQTQIALRMKIYKKTTSQPSLPLTGTEKDESRNNNSSNVDGPPSSSNPEQIDDYSIADDVRSDRRVRLVIITEDYAAIQFNGPILKFSESNPFLTEQALTSLGPDPLKPNFSYSEARIRFDARLKMKLADLLLDQTFVAGIGNKYKSELLFICMLYPFITAGNVSAEKRDFLINKISEVLNLVMRMQGELAPCWRAKSIINGISGIGFLDGQVNPAGFAVTQSSLTELVVLG